MNSIKKCIAVIAVVMMMASMALGVHAESSSFNGATLGYNYSGYFSLTQTYVSASLEGEAEISNEETADAPILVVSGHVEDINDVVLRTIYGRGIKYCAYSSSIGSDEGAYAAGCDFSVEGRSVSYRALVLGNEDPYP